MTGGEQGPPHLPLGSDMRPPPWPCQEETSLYLYLVPWETDLERRRSAGSFPSCPNALRAEPGGCRKQGGGTRVGPRRGRRGTRVCHSDIPASPTGTQSRHPSKLPSPETPVPGVGQSLDPSYPKWGAHFWAGGLWVAEGDSQKMSRVTTVPGRDCSTGLWRWAPGNTPLHPSHTLPRNLCGCTCMCAMQPCVYCYVMHVFPETAEDVEGFSRLLLRPRGSPDSVSCTSELHSPLQERSIHWKLVFRKTNVFILVNRLLIKFPMPCSSSWGCLLQAVGVNHSWPLRPRVMFWTVINAPQCGHFSNFSSRLWASGSWGQWVIQSYCITDGLFHLLFFYLWLPRWAFLW